MCALKVGAWAVCEDQTAAAPPPPRLQAQLLPPTRVQEGIIADLERRREGLRRRLAEAARGDERARSALAARLRQRDQLRAEAARLLTSLQSLRHFARGMRQSASHVSVRALETKDRETMVAASKRLGRLDDRLHLEQQKCSVALQQCGTERDRVMQALSSTAQIGRHYLRLVMALCDAETLLGRLLQQGAKSLDEATELCGPLRAAERRLQVAATPSHSNMLTLLRLADDSLVRFLARQHASRSGGAAQARLTRTRDVRQKAWGDVLAEGLALLLRARASREDCDRVAGDLQLLQHVGVQQSLRLRALRRSTQQELRAVLQCLEHHRAEPAEQAEAETRSQIQATAHAKEMSELVQAILKQVLRLYRALGCDEADLQEDGGLSADNLERHMAAMAQRVREIHARNLPPEPQPLLQDMLEAGEAALGVSEEPGPMMVVAVCMERAESRRVTERRPLPMSRDHARHLLLTSDIVRSEVLACGHGAA
ncbi:uncharacterized protein LOC134531378 [Bacillus rossius redtenbacheri]|uniref:uncharacterized protein LOC134531378 n=1 Tax=Bacillus rossius redtenbacheri TaxID=93214 RepID=UPI002FDCBC77